MTTRPATTLELSGIRIHTTSGRLAWILYEASHELELWVDDRVDDSPFDLQPAVLGPTTFLVDGRVSSTAVAQESWPSVYDSPDSPDIPSLME